MTEVDATGNKLTATASGIKDKTDETNEKLEEVKTGVKAIQSSVDEIETRGLKIRT